jgi:hypothetical protein
MERIQLHGRFTVDGIVSQPARVLDRLRQLLAAGVEAEPDAHRPNFFTLLDGTQLFYFYISPVSAKVWLVQSHAAPAIPAGVAASAARA